MGALLLARHGSTVQNEPPERLRGWQDLPLDRAGRGEAQKLADRVKTLPIGLIWTSDLKRAVVTAHDIADTNIHHPPVRATTALRPWNVGDYEAVVTTKAAPALRPYLQEPTQIVPGGESVTDFANRFLPFFKRLLAQVRGTDMIMAVTHTRVIRLALEFLKSSNQINFSTLMGTKDPVQPGDFLVISWSGSHWVVSSSHALTRGIPTSLGVH